MADSWVLISGASTGIGRAAAVALAERGFHVLAGVRAEKAGAALVEMASPGVRARLMPIQLDVTNAESIAAAVALAADKSGSNGLRVLINNAGIVVPGPVEYLSLDDWRRQFEVNFFGAIGLTRAVLPLLRKAVTAHGRGLPRVVLISSIGGRVAQPFIAPYTSSKFALTALGDSLRLELRRQGIGVTVIEPGAVKTEIWAKGDSAGAEFTPDHPAYKLYGTEIEGLIALSRRTAARGLVAERAAEEIVGAVAAPRAPARVLVGTDAKIMARLKALLPTSVFDGVLAKEFGIPKL
jgi:NAD(P)-dependent dehydrogenase (short-subunit alcohol dehydrogenase family)